MCIRQQTSPATSARTAKVSNIRVTFAVIGLVATLLVATSAPAHQSWSFSGEVIKLTATTMVVRTPEGRNITVPMGAAQNVVVVAGEKTVSVKDIKVGQKVEVNTFSDVPDDFYGAEIRILSPAPGGS